MSLSQVTTLRPFYCDMPKNAIPVDVLLNILEYVDKADLATMCRVNKICCSCSQDVLYREIYVNSPRVHQTLAQSTHLARMVRSFSAGFFDSYTAIAFRNMTSLRILKLPSGIYLDILDGCTFKLDAFECSFVHGRRESYLKFLSNQPSLKYVDFPMSFGATLEATCLPNLTSINAGFPWLPCLIPGRPLNHVVVRGYASDGQSIDLSFFALSTAPVQILSIDYSYLYSTPGHLLASFLPSLTHFKLTVWKHHTFTQNEGVCGLP